MRLNGYCHSPRDAAREEMKSAPDILIIKLSALGDVVHSLCVLHALKEHWPDSRIDWVCGEAAHALLEGHPLIDNLILYPRRELGMLCSSVARWPDLAPVAVKFAAELRKRRYDIVIDLQGLLKSGIIAGLARGKRKIGFAGGREFSSLFLNEKLPPYDPDEHAVLRYMRVAKHLGAYSGGKLRFPLGLTESDMEHARETVESHGLKPEKTVGLIPGTRWPTKHWTPEGFAHAADLVRRETGLEPAIIGGPGDRDLARQINALARHPVTDLTGKTSLKTLAGVLSMLSAVITTDTGPMHIAAAGGIPVVALFGPTSPGRTGPFTDKSRVVTMEYECSPCFRRQCGNTRCMKDIQPERVVKALLELL